MAVVSTVARMKGRRVQASNGEIIVVNPDSRFERARNPQIAEADVADFVAAGLIYDPARDLDEQRAADAKTEKGGRRRRAAGGVVQGGEGERREGEVERVEKGDAFDTAGGSQPTGLQTRQAINFDPNQRIAQTLDPEKAAPAAGDPDAAPASGGKAPAKAATKPRRRAKKPAAS